MENQVEIRIVYLGLGASLGDRIAHLRFAVERLAALPDTRVTGASRVYETEPVGGAAKNDFLNAAARLETRLSPEALFGAIRKIEDDAGRRRHERWEDRVLDIDVLFFGDLRIDDGRFTVPHPRLHERRFVLVPLCNIAPDFIDPLSGKAARELLAECTDKARVAATDHRLEF